MGGRDGPGEGLADWLGDVGAGLGPEEVRMVVEVVPLLKVVLRVGFAVEEDRSTRRQMLSFGATMSRERSLGGIVTRSSWPGFRKVMLKGLASLMMK